MEHAPLLTSNSRGKCFLFSPQNEHQCNNSASFHPNQKTHLEQVHLKIHSYRVKASCPLNPWAATAPCFTFSSAFRLNLNIYEITGKNMYLFHNKLNTPEQFSSSSMSLQKLSMTESAATPSEFKCLLASHFIFYTCIFKWSQKAKRTAKLCHCCWCLWPQAWVFK